MKKSVKSVHYDSKNLSYLGPKIWDLLPKNIKDSENINMCKSNIKLWKPEECS